MNMIPILMGLLIVLALPAAWFVSEFRATSRGVRCALGVLAILCSFGVAWLAAQLTRLNYNTWYGVSSKALIDVIVEKLDAGQTEMLKSELKSLQTAFRPTYESRAHYNELVDAAVRKIKSNEAANQVPEDAVPKLADPPH